MFIHFCLRKSNLAPHSVRDVKSEKFVLRKDVKRKWYFNNLHEMVKTNQFGQRISRSLLLSFPQSVLCPVQDYLNMCHAVKAEDSAPLFSLWKGKCITYLSFQNNPRHLIDKTGLDPTEFSTHSFRRGSATFALNQKFQQFWSKLTETAIKNICPSPWKTEF